MNNIIRAWRASFVRRWHSNPDLCDTVDPISGHQQRVALLLLLIYPDCSKALLAAAVTHDQGEAATGDVSYDVKNARPELRDMLADAEAQEIHRQGFRIANLTEREARILKLCDWLDAWLWMRMRRPELETRPDWIEQRDRMICTAQNMGLDAVWDVIHAKVR